MSHSVPGWRILHLRTNSPDDKNKHAPLCQLDVGLFAGILLCCSCELFSYDQLTDVNAVAQKVRDHLFSMSYCSIGVSETHRHVMWINVRVGICKLCSNHNINNKAFVKACRVMSSLLHMLVCASLLHIRAHGVFPSVAMTTFTCAWIMRLFPITRVRTYVKLLLPFTCNFHYSLRVVVNFSTAIIHIPHYTATQKEQVCLQAAVLIYLHLMRNDFVWQYSTLFDAI